MHGIGWSPWLILNVRVELAHLQDLGLDIQSEVPLWSATVSITHYNESYLSLIRFVVELGLQVQTLMLYLQRDGVTVQT
jgi:hypothetical protein